ncbi:MAG: MFS transporter [Acidimicrobiales bacterium]
MSFPRGERTDPGPQPTPGVPRPLGRRFGYLWATFAVSSLGDGLGYGAVPLLALFVNPHPLPVASVAAADTFPWLVLALPAGALADRFERGRLMALTNLGRALVLVTLALLVASGHINLPLLILLVFVNGGARAIYYSASQATVPELVEPRSFAHANGFLSGTEAATEHLGGPILGTLAFAVVKTLPFFADASAVGIAGLSLLGFRTERQTRDSVHGSILDGARHLVKDPSLRLLVTLLAALAALQGLVMGVLVIIATVDWGVPKELYGMFLAAGAVGNVPGALLADSFASRLGNIRTLIASALVSGLAYLVMASAKGWLLAGLAFAVVSFAVYAGSVVANSLRQRLSPRDLMGRIGAAWRGVVWGAFPIGSLIGGGLAVLGGLRLPLYIAGAAQCAVALVIARPLARSLASSERAAAAADQVSAAGGTTVLAFADRPHSNGGPPLTPSCDGAVPAAASVASQAVQASPKRRLHSRAGHGPLYWGRSSRNSRR